MPVTALFTTAEYRAHLGVHQNKNINRKYGLHTQWNFSSVKNNEVMSFQGKPLQWELAIVNELSLSQNENIACWLPVVALKFHEDI